MNPSAEGAVADRRELVGFPAYDEAAKRYASED